MSQRSGSNRRAMSKQVSVRLTPAQHERLSRWADLWLISIPDLLRTVAFDSEFCPPPSHHCGKMTDHEPHVWSLTRRRTYECSGKTIVEGGRGPIPVRVRL